MDDILSAWWRLSQAKGMGRQSLWSLHDTLGSLQALLDTPATELAELGLSAAALRQLTETSQPAALQRLLQWPAAPGQGILLRDDPHYPDALGSLADAPLWLSWLGDITSLQQPMVAIVGSRNPTPYARDWAWQCAHDLARAGVCVVSGLALGIDGAAHEGALAGAGSTVAVLGCGIDVIYPKRHRSLYQRIAQQGLILSELDPGTAPLPAFFPGRNRIVSGLSQAVIVVEAAAKSGSLITARLAANQGREVMALPGAVTNPLADGCHQLIRDGALLVRDASDVLEELGVLVLQSSPASDTSTPESAAGQTPALVTQLDFASATSLDVLAIRTGQPVPELMATLLQLELEGWLQQEPGGYRRLR